MTVRLNLVIFNGPRCFEGMEGASYYREQADHVRELAEMTWQAELEALLRRVARDYEEVAEDLEAGAADVRHPELLHE
jgi:hypothetical protein